MAAWRSRSISSLIVASFSMKVSVWVRLRLVVVVVGNEVLDSVVGKELAELVGQLGGQGLVRGQHECGLLNPFDGPGDGDRLTRSGYAEQRLITVPAFKSGGKGVDGLRLIASWLEIGYNFESGHSRQSSERVRLILGPGVG